MTAGHEKWMRLALRLARRGEGLTRPNPPVGAIVVKNGKAVGQGYHRRAGGAHAEIIALKRAGRKARGASLYVTLEPCCTWGRTPPCTDAILAAGVGHVIVGVRDPNPSHAGRGLALLRRRNVKITEGICEEEAAELIAPFRQWITKRRPYATLKLGVTLDGRIADARGKSRWITGPAARQVVHGLRRRVDAILVGRGTAVKDDPRLLPNPAHGRKPYRVIVDSTGSIGPRARILSDAAVGQTIVATTARCPASRRKRLGEAGAMVLVLPSSNERVSLRPLFRHLARLGILHVLCEGGGELAASLIRARLADELIIFIAPKLLGKSAIPAMGGPGWALTSAPQLRFHDVERVGPDILIRARVEGNR